MGAARHGRALTAFAGALVVLVPSIAMAKTLEGTKTGSEPLQGAVSGPPATGTVAPMIVPPSTVAGSDPPSPAITTDDGKKPDVGDPSFEEPAEESRRSSGAVRSSPAASTASPNASQPAGFSSPGVREAGATTIPVTAPQGAPRQAGPSLPQPRTVEAAPTALALRERASGSPSDSDSDPDPGSGATGGADTSGSNGALSTAAPSVSTLLPRAVPLQQGSSFVSCATLPSPGASNDRIVWTNARTAAITAGRDLRPTERVAALAGTSVIWDTSARVEAYVLHPNTFAVMARFVSSGERSGEPIDFIDQPLPGLEIGDCDGRPAMGIAPGTYLLRYAFTGTLSSTWTVGTETFLSPPVPVRVIAGPTAPTGSESPEP